MRPGSRRPIAGTCERQSGGESTGRIVAEPRGVGENGGERASVAQSPAQPPLRLLLGVAVITRHGRADERQRQAGSRRSQRMLGLLKRLGGDNTIGNTLVEIGKNIQFGRLSVIL